MEQIRNGGVSYLEVSSYEETVLSICILVIVFGCLRICHAGNSDLDCDRASDPTATATASPLPTNNPLPTETSTPVPTPTLSYPAEGTGPSNFPLNVDPLTGVEVTDPTLLDRRPMLIKVSNIPRYNPPAMGAITGRHRF